MKEYKIIPGVSPSFLRSQSCIKDLAVAYCDGIVQRDFDGFKCEEDWDSTDNFHDARIEQKMESEYREIKEFMRRKLFDSDESLRNYIDHHPAPTLYMEGWEWSWYHIVTEDYCYNIALHSCKSCNEDYYWVYVSLRPEAARRIILEENTKEELHD